MYGYYGLMLPDLSELQKKVEGEIARIFNFSHHAFTGHDVFVFAQTWASTALGFGGFGGSALTTKYTTVFRTHLIPIYRKSENLDDRDMIFYTVFFDSEFAYIIPSENGRNSKIEDDIKKRQMKSVTEAKDYE